MSNFFYKVLVAGTQYHGKEPLTYSYTAKLVTGSVVSVPLRKHQTLGVVSSLTTIPEFTTKPLHLLDVPPLPDPLMKLMDWLKVYYPAPLGNVVQQFLPGQLSSKDITKTNDTPSPLATLKLPDLTEEQKQVIKKIKNSGTYLLHGETGSGKTRVYQELALRSMRNGKSVIILTPEISLTSQLYKSFQDIFGDQVVMVHSGLKATERKSAWLQALRSKQPLVVIGARSAIFSPLKQVGLIVVDEAHEQAYKQEQAPHYHASRVASKLAELHNATLILGSATPSVNDYFLAEQKNVPVLRMQQLATGSTEKVSVQVVDIKDRSNFTHSQYISNLLLESIEQALGNSEQALVFLNRRGTARAILCSVCGWQAKCPNCDIPLTYHGDTHVMQCHICGHKEPAVSTCPVCDNTEVIFKGAGTKAVVEELQRLFPKAAIQRFDTDNKKSERFEQHYHTIRQGSVDILVGTQTLAKGLDLPRLSVVGVITADTGLSIPDYTAQERLYQLTSQVIGRVGRGHRQGQAIVQTYSPDNPVLIAAINKDWRRFYNKELAERTQFTYPPFCHVLKFICRRASDRAAQKSANEFAEKLRQMKLKIDINGPAPSFYEKQNGKFSWQIIVKAKRRQELLNIIDLLPSGWSYDIDPANLL